MCDSGTLLTTQDNFSQRRHRGVPRAVVPLGGVSHPPLAGRSALKRSPPAPRIDRARGVRRFPRMIAPSGIFAVPSARLPASPAARPVPFFGGSPLDDCPEASRKNGVRKPGIAQNEKKRRTSTPGRILGWVVSRRRFRSRYAWQGPQALEGRVVCRPARMQGAFPYERYARVTHPAEIASTSPRFPDSGKLASTQCNLRTSRVMSSAVC